MGTSHYYTASVVLIVKGKDRSPPAFTGLELVDEPLEESDSVESSKLRLSNRRAAGVAIATLVNAMSGSSSPSA